MEEYPTLNLQDTKFKEKGGKPTKTAQAISKTTLDNTLHKTKLTLKEEIRHRVEGQLAAFKEAITKGINKMNEEIRQSRKV
eukprot:10173023-Ditylum_brightwellii.AAC.1